jgi:hypothetical protein
MSKHTTTGRSSLAHGRCVGGEVSEACRPSPDPGIGMVSCAGRCPVHFTPDFGLFGTNESDRRLHGLVSIGGDESDHGASLTTTLTRQTSVERVSARCAAATATCHRGRGGHWANLQATRSPRQPATRCDVLLQLYAPRGRVRPEGHPLRTNGITTPQPPLRWEIQRWNHPPASTQCANHPPASTQCAPRACRLVGPLGESGRHAELYDSAQVGSSRGRATISVSRRRLPRRCFRRFTFRSPGWSTARCLAKRCW